MNKTVSDYDAEIERLIKERDELKSKDFLVKFGSKIKLDCSFGVANYQLNRFQMKDNDWYYNLSGDDGCCWSYSKLINNKTGVMFSELQAFVGRSNEIEVL